MSKLVNFVKNNRRFDIYLIFFTTILIYLLNLSPSVYGNDSGDFLTAALTNGVAHPSGYPLYTMLGILFLKLPIAATPAWKFGLASCLLTSSAVTLFYLTSKEIIKERYLSVIASFMFAFSYPVWMQAEVVEVFSLQVFFISLITFLTTKFIQTKLSKYLYILAFTVGLSITNNLSILLIFPAVFIAAFFVLKKNILRPKLILRCIAYFTIGLVPYAYIYLAARTFPKVNWGMAVNLENFISHILRKRYGWGISTERVFDNSSNATQGTFAYVQFWKNYVNPISMVLSLLGFIYLAVTKRTKLLIYFLIAFSFLGPFFVLHERSSVPTYNVFSILERFYLQSAVIYLFGIPMGMLLIRNILTKLTSKSIFKSFVIYSYLVVLLVLPTTIFLLNVKRTNLSNVNIGDNLGFDLLRSLPANSMVYLTNDNKYFNSLYIQMAYNYRRDIVIPGSYNNFRDILEANNITDEEEIINYQTEHLGTIEHDLAYRSILIELDKGRNVFTDFVFKFNLSDEKKGRVVYIPYGLLYKLEFDSESDEPLNDYLNKINAVTKYYQIDQAYYYFPDYNSTFADVNNYYSTGYYQIAEYLHATYSDSESSQNYLKKAVETSVY